MKGKYISIIGLILCTVALTLLAVAYNAYPQGDSYPTEQWATLGNAASTEVPEYATTPSPKSNPGWVRFLQNNGEIIGIVSMLGLVISLISVTEQVRKKRENH